MESVQEGDGEGERAVGAEQVREAERQGDDARGSNHVEVGRYPRWSGMEGYQGHCARAQQGKEGEANAAQERGRAQVSHRRGRCQKDGFVCVCVGGGAQIWAGKAGASLSNGSLPACGSESLRI